MFAGLDVKEAVFWLLDFAGYRRDENVSKIQNTIPHQKKAEKKKPFVLPEFAGSNAYLYHYLEHERKIARPVIDFFVRKGIMYEAKNYHNIIFVGTDKDGVPRFASMRGVFDKNGVGFRCDVEGNDKRYGFHFYCRSSKKVVVFEAAIDLMSYITMFPKDRASMVALGMVADAPLETFLAEHPEVEEIQFCLDNDGPGRKAAANLQQKYTGMGYQTKVFLPPKPYKDFNDWNVKIKKAQEQEKNRETARAI